MRILVSNDDGIHARGIQTLARTLSREHEVYMVAPEMERSATAHALTLHKPIRVKELDMDFSVKQAFAITGTPSDCVKIGLNALLDVDIDLVVSGINHGPNLGADVLYSGTVSAALEGAINGLPSIAVSLMNGYEKLAEFSHGAEFILKFIDKAMAVGIPAKTILNVNIPAVPLHDMAGVRLTQLGRSLYTDTYERRTDPRGGVYYWLAGEIIDVDQAEDTDLQVIRNNQISITPVHFDLTSYDVLHDLREKASILEGLL
ncbi:MAG: 5'/3'-nucleotidase SurE [Candidatus Melainabacteria bacterium]